MASIDDVVAKAEAILASAKKYKGDGAERYELMKQVDLLYQELGDPMDASEIRHATCYRFATDVLSA